MKREISTLVRDLEFKTIIGMLDFERVTPQKVRINAEFASGEFIDYAKVASMTQQFYDERKFQSVEESVDEISKFFKDKFPSLIWLKFEILKLEIIQNANVGAKIHVTY